MTKVYLPKSFTKQDYLDALNKYIDSDNVIENYLQRILLIHTINNDVVNITEEIKGKASIKLKKIETYSLERNDLIKTKVHVEFIYEIKREFKHQFENQNIKCSYNKKILEKNIDVCNILYNFIHVFEFVSPIEMCCEFISKESHYSTFEIVNRSHSSKIYNMNYSAQIINTIQDMIIRLYYNLLMKHKYSLEKFIESFFMEYLPKEFGIPPIILSLPDPNAKFSDKCYKILAAYENVLRQYAFFAKTKKIDLESVKYASNAIDIYNIPSLNDQKYLQINQDCISLCNILFSNQNRILYANSRKDILSLKNFAEALKKLKLNLSDFYDSVQMYFIFLKKYKIIEIDQDKNIRIVNPDKLIVLRILYENGFVSPNHYPKNFNHIFQQFINDQLVTENNKLFSTQESDFISYILNRKNFDNGPQLRNSYMHGIQQLNTEEQSHEMNYYIILKIFICTLLKINDDLILYYDSQN